MPVKVSVIVPVYNPGAYLDRCIASVVGQSLLKTEYEAIFVDDGSTDGSPARLDAVAAAHPNIRVIHQENSGWPGQPRNVGIAAASGEYVFFADHDDELGPEALERLYDFAIRNRSDVVIGKTVGQRRGARPEPATAMTLRFHALFARTRNHVTLWDAPIVDSLTPHKLFRRAFLAEHGLRFPEGRRRFEDHVFVLESYFAASVISVLADPVCYYRYERMDRRNASAAIPDPNYYFGFLREVLGVVEGHTEPGRQRDALVQRFARVELLERLRGPRFLGHPAGYRATLFAAIRSVVEDHVAPTVDEFLAPFQRTQVALVRAGRLDLVVEAAKWEHRLAGKALHGGVERRGSGSIELATEVTLTVGRRPLALERRGERFLLDVPRGVAAVVPDNARAVVVPVHGGASVRVRRHKDSAELAIPGHAERRIEERNGRWMIVDRVEATIDTWTFASGPASRPATWDVVMRIDLVGVTRELRVARLEVTADHDVVVRRRPPVGDRALARAIRRAGRDGLIFASHHMGDRLRLRLRHVRARIARLRDRD